MKRSIWKRIKWVNVSLLLATVAVTTAGAYGIYTNKPIFDYSRVKPSHVVTYSYRIREGDTLWHVASTVALPEDDLQRLVFRIMEDNKIKNPGAIQPGTVIQITVHKRHRQHPMRLVSLEWPNQTIGHVSSQNRLRMTWKQFRFKEVYP